mgnify:CR=1 FL=1
MKTAARMIAAAAAALVSLGAGAQALQDPTRPPASLMASTKGAAAAPVLMEGPRLQSILIAPTAGGRHVAIIDGQTVRPGENFKGWRVEHMTQAEVVLSKGGKKQVLKLFPQPVQR